jgi:hypothetical protein
MRWNWRIVGVPITFFNQKNGKMTAFYFRFDNLSSFGREHTVLEHTYTEQTQKCVYLDLLFNLIGLLQHMDLDKWQRASI